MILYYLELGTEIELNLSNHNIVNNIENDSTNLLLKPIEIRINDINNHTIQLDMTIENNNSINELNELSLNKINNLLSPKLSKIDYYDFGRNEK